MGYVSRGSTLPEPELDCWFRRRKGLQLKSGGSGARGVASAGGGCRIAYSRRVRASDELRVPIGCRTPGAEGLFSIAGRSADPECAGVAGVAGVAGGPVLPVLPVRRTAGVAGGGPFGGVRRTAGVAGGGPVGGTGTPRMADSVCTRSLCCTLKA